MTTGSDPAFPAEPKTQNDLGITYRGLTKREWFAGIAMNGLISNEIAHERGFTIDGKKMSVCEAAYFMADEMLKEGDK